MALWWLLACLVGTSDEDGDSFAPSDGDCDDTRASVYPGADEVCDGDDNDCDGVTDGHDAVDASIWYLDLDGDGAAGTAVSACALPDGASATQDDCDDLDASRHPGADEDCDGVDQDCDGQVDEELQPGENWLDLDGDGFGDSDEPVTDCSAEGAIVSNPDDCDDSDGAVNPDAEEICDDGLDNDCDGTLGGCAPEGSLSLGDAQAVFVAGQAGDLLNSPVAPGAGVGDVDGDGELDFLLGATSRNSSQGAAYLVLGPVTGDVALSTAALVLNGEGANVDSGTTVLVGGDLLGDGGPTLVVASRSSSLGGSISGAVHVVPGSARGDVTLPGGGISVIGSGGDHLGDGVVASVDLDGDGLVDLAAGALTGGSSEAGVVYLMSGPLTSSTSVSAHTGRLLGEEAGDRAGQSLASADFDGDGVADLMVGSNYGSSGGERTGAVWLVLGPLDGGDQDLADAEVRFSGVEAGDELGRCPAIAGDVDGDGSVDLILDALADSVVADFAGAAWLVTSPLTQSGSLESSAAARLEGAAEGDNFGYCTAGAGDVDRDGDDDFLVSAKYADVGGDQSGAVYLVLDDVLGTWAIADVSVEYRGEAAGDNAGHGLAGGFDVNHDGLSDWLVTAPSSGHGGTPELGAAFLMLGHGL